MQADKMFVGETEEWFNSPVISDRYPYNEPEENPEPDLTMIFGIQRVCPIPANPCLPVCTTKRCGIRCRNKQVPSGPPDPGIGEGGRGTKRVQVYRMKMTGAEQSVHILIEYFNRKAG
jgi:hypothetical protein